jgi:hypothetical protein
MARRPWWRCARKGRRRRRHSRNVKGTRSEIQTSSSQRTKSFGEVLEEMHKRREEETTVWKRKREEILRQVKRL